MGNGRQGFHRTGRDNHAFGTKSPTGNARGNIINAMHLVGQRADFTSLHAQFMMDIQRTGIRNDQMSFPASRLPEHLQ